MIVWLSHWVIEDLQHFNKKLSSILFMQVLWSKYKIVPTSTKKKVWKSQKFWVTLLLSKRIQKSKIYIYLSHSTNIYEISKSLLRSIYLYRLKLKGNCAFLCEVFILEKWEEVVFLSENTMPKGAHQCKLLTGVGRGGYLHQMCNNGDFVIPLRGKLDLVFSKIT